ncbi:MAG TPA: ATP-binding protein [Amycolatopsis sp.]|uniref:sensor histidine kinase n=1 Tax=Amycolatopsis sp. TaxID=37632 RepID=UPI002B4A440E|nr:ATP-binding protein [Amycolatopsis sp.]HKS44884.1 ATP-binding protein [Amycolatopsis sp.]
MSPEEDFDYYGSDLPDRDIQPLWEVGPASADPVPDRAAPVEDRPAPATTGSWTYDTAPAEDAGGAGAIERGGAAGESAELVTALSRRNQNLVERQRLLIEQLERDIDDPDQLAALFQLDRLATRMRRNIDNLMVLAGTESARPLDKPAVLGDVLWAAVAEIEHYERVVIDPPPRASIVCYAANDLVRLIAELLDNATAFSDPEARVTVVTRIFEGGGGVQIDIVDQGMGMTEAELADANLRLTDPVMGDLAAARPLGLFMAGRLAARHGIAVTLHGGREVAGLRAGVTVPADLVIELKETVPLSAPVLDEPANEPAAKPPPERDDTRYDAWLGTLTGLAEDPEPAGDAGWAQDSGSLGYAEREPEAEAAPRWREPEPVEPEPAEVSLSDWWDAENPVAPEPSLPERVESTPIFEMISAWFRDEPGQPPEAARAAEATSGWDFAADVGFRAVQAASQSEPTSYTEAGLPRRRRGEQLMPGGIIAAAGTNVPKRLPEPGQSIPVRDADDVRGRLSSFQRGVNRARHAACEQPAQESPDEPAAWSFNAEENRTPREPSRGLRPGARRGRHRADPSTDPGGDTR